MKKIITLLTTILIISLTAKAQIQADPAHWAYGIKKLSGNNYEIHLRCTIDTGWHIYAQQQTSDFIGTKTKIEFDKQSCLTLIGKPLEAGKKDIYTDKAAGITNFEYAGVVDFIQKATIKPGIKLITGKVTYQTCTHKECLSAQTVSFSVPLP